MRKTAPSDHAIHELIGERWSPYWFDNRPISNSDMCAIMEAARWAPSSYNEQPWCFLMSNREDVGRHAPMVECLIEGNRTWAREAPILLLGLTHRSFAQSGEPNPACEHDLGLAAASLTLEASARGIQVHQMSGILRARIRETYRVPADVTPLTALALGYCAAAKDVPDRYQDRQNRARERKPLSSFVYAGSWEESAKLN